MGFPEFEERAAKVLFFSRGRGRGHAIPDIEIGRALQALRSDAEVRFVSYGTGARTFTELGIPVIDTGLAENGANAEMSALAGRLIRWLNPDLVVSHEEFAAAPVAKIFDKPVLFFTDWFGGGESYAMRSLLFADEIVFLGPPGMFAAPAWVQNKVRYLGPFVRFDAKHRDKASLRAKYGVSAGATVVGVFPGSWTEAMAPVLELVLAAYDSLPFDDKALVWVAGADRDEMQARMAGRNGVVLLDRTWEMDEWMALCDVAITKTSRKTAYELAYLRVPQVALSYELNPNDDRVTRSLPGVEWLRIEGLDAESVVRALQSGLRSGPQAGLETCSAAACAEIVSKALDRARSAAADGQAR